MSYFIFDGVLKSGEEYELGGDESRHLIRSRRLRSGDRFLIQDYKGQRFEAVIIELNRKELTFIPEFSVATPLPSSLRLEILQALTKEKSIDWILQKSTELGVTRIDLFCGKHSPISFRILKRRNLLDRWNRIVLEASKQCGRQFPPDIFFHENLAKTLEKLTKCPHSWLLSPGIENSVSWKNIYKEEHVEMHHRILVGPEGGFHSDEIDLALRSGLIPIDLGPRIIRSETAVITATSILQFLWGDLK